MNNLVRIKTLPKKILVISDLHIPNHHKKSFSFLKKLKKKYKPDLVIQIGDLVDLGTISSYDLDPHYISAKEEHLKSIKYIKKLIEIFPKMYITIGNHDVRALRKGRKFGIPSDYFKSFADLYNTPKDWVFCQSIVVGNDKNSILFTHGRSKIPLKLTRTVLHSTVEGHFHTHFFIAYLQSETRRYFSMRTGCLIDDNSPVFSYNKYNTDRPILGVGLITDGIPSLEPFNEK